MPKVKTETIYIRDNGKEFGGTVKMQFKLDINVSTDGDFTATLPEDVVTKLESAGVHLNSNGRRGSRKGFFSAGTMQKLLEDIRKQCNKYVARTLVEETIVLRYIIKTACSYVKGISGEIYSSLYAAPTEDTPKDDEWKWLGGTTELNANSREPWSLNLQVAPFIKKVYRLPDGEIKTEYVRISFVDEIFLELQNKRKKLGANMKFLACIVGMPDLTNEYSKIQELEYTNDIGHFFVTFLKYICTFSEKIKDLATNPELIKELAANAGSVKLLGNG